MSCQEVFTWVGPDLVTPSHIFGKIPDCSVALTPEGGRLKNEAVAAFTPHVAVTQTENTTVAPVLLGALLPECL